MDYLRKLGHKDNVTFHSIRKMSLIHVVIRCCGNYQDLVTAGRWSDSSAAAMAATYTRDGGAIQIEYAGQGITDPAFENWTWKNRLDYKSLPSFAALGETY